MLYYELSADGFNIYSCTDNTLKDDITDELQEVIKHKCNFDLSFCNDKNEIVVKRLIYNPESATVDTLKHILLYNLVETGIVECASYMARRSCNYIRKNAEPLIEPYIGRYGKGYTIKWHCPRSGGGCYMSTYIFPRKKYLV